MRNEPPIPLHSSFGKARSPRACSGVRLPVKQAGNNLLARPRPNSGSRRTHRGLTSLQSHAFLLRSLKQNCTEAKRTHSHRCTPSYVSRRQVRNRATHLLIGGKQQRNCSRRLQSGSPKTPLPHVFGNSCRLMPCNLTGRVMDPTYLASWQCSCK